MVQDAGGETLVRAAVAEIIIERGRAIGVRMDTGEEFFASKVVSAAGALNTTNRLLPQEYRCSKWAREIADIPQSPAYVCLYLGLEGDVAAAGASRSNLWFYETWDMEVSEWDVTKPDSEAPVIFMSLPSLRDPSHDPGPTGRHTAEVMTFVPWDAFAKWEKTRRAKRGTDYLAFKKNIETRLVAQLTRYMPDLMSLVKYKELSTPLSTAYFTWAPRGAPYGLEATPRRFISRNLQPRTPIKPSAGCDVATMGVMGALGGGLIAAGAVHPRILLPKRL